MLPLASGTAVGDIPGNDTRGAIYRGGIPMVGLWAWWYRDMSPSERLLLPPGTTQEQRIRLRDTFSLQPQTHFYPLANGTIDQSGIKNAIEETLDMLPSKDVIRVIGGALTPFDKYVTWDPADERWDAVEQIGADDAPRVPALHHNTWHDVGVGEMIRLFEYLQSMDTPNQHLIIGSGPHCAALQEEAIMADLRFGDLHVGDARYGGSDRGYAKLFLDWYGHWLKGEDNGITDMPKVQLHVKGKGWITGDVWPLEETQFTTYYLDSDGRAESRMASGTLSTDGPGGAAMDTWVYDPSLPVPSRGGGCCGDAMALDQSDIEIRSDVLTYTTPVLEEGVTIAGPIDVVLYVSSSAKDTDFMVKLVDVYPDGTAINLADDAIRARYREGFDKQVFMRARRHLQGAADQPGHRQPLPGRAPHPHRGGLEQLPGARTQPEHRRQKLRRDRVGGGREQRAPYARAPVAHRVAGIAGVAGKSITPPAQRTQRRRRWHPGCRRVPSRLGGNRRAKWPDCRPGSWIRPPCRCRARAGRGRPG